MEEASWVGKAVSIHCTEHLGVFQGTIKDLSSDQLTIVRAFRNGVPLKKQDAEVTLRLERHPKSIAPQIHGRQLRGY